MDEYQMNVHIFILHCKFFSKARCKDPQKVITKLADKGFYMDDFLKTGDCVEDLVNIATQLLQLLFDNGFRLTK